MSLLLFSVAFSIPMAILEQKETAAGGDYHFGDFTASYDCNKTVVIHIILDSKKKEPVEGAIVRLFYEERFTPILASGVTDENGDYTYFLIGDPEKMANLFMFTVEKPDFRTKEGHFVLPLADCLEPEEVEEPEVPEIEVPEEVIPEVNETVNDTNQTDNGIYVPLENETEETGDILGVCPFSLVILLLLLYKVA